MKLTEWERMVGRTHRAGQQSELHVEFESRAYLGICPRCRQLLLIARGCMVWHGSKRFKTCPGSGNPPAVFGPKDKPDSDKSRVRKLRLKDL